MEFFEGRRCEPPTLNLVPKHQASFRRELIGLGMQRCDLLICEVAVSFR